MLYFIRSTVSLSKVSLTFINYIVPALFSVPDPLKLLGGLVIAGTMVQVRLVRSKAHNSLLICSVGNSAPPNTYIVFCIHVCVCAAYKR